MRITLHQLKVFAIVAKNQSVTKAAHELHMTQPAVSNILRQLQEYFDCELVEVIGRKLSLTPFGLILLEGGRQMHDTLSLTKARMEQLKGGLVGSLKIATVTTAKYFVPHLLGRFKEKYQDVKIELTVCNRHTIIQRLQNNEDDFVVMSHPPSDLVVDVADFYSDELVIAASNDTALSKDKKCIKLSELALEPWIFREEGSGTRYATENVFREKKFHPQVEMIISDNEAIKQALMANLGIAAISKQSIKNELKHNMLAELQVEDFPAQHTWYLVKNRHKALSPIAERFYTFVNHHQPVFTQIF